MKKNIKNYENINLPIFRETTRSFFQNWKSQRDVVKKLYPNYKNPTSHPTINKYFNLLKKWDYIDNKKAGFKNVTRGGVTFVRNYPNSLFRLNINFFFEYLQDKGLKLTSKDKEFLNLIFSYEEIRGLVLKENNILEGIKQVVKLLFDLNKTKITDIPSISYGDDLIESFGLKDVVGLINKKIDNPGLSKIKWKKVLYLENNKIIINHNKLNNEEKKIICTAWNFKSNKKENYKLFIKYCLFSIKDITIKEIEDLFKNSIKENFRTIINKLDKNNKKTPYLILSILGIEIKVNDKTVQKLYEACASPLDFYWIEKDLFKPNKITKPKITNPKKSNIKKNNPTNLKIMPIL